MSIATESNTLESLVEMAGALSAKERLNLVIALAKDLKKEVGGKKAGKKVKKESSEDEGEEKEKKEPSEKQKAWRDFIARVREVVNGAHPEDDKFKYREGMQVAATMKDNGEMEGASDEAILGAYQTWVDSGRPSKNKTKKDSASDAGSVAEEKKEVKKPAPASAKKAEKKEEEKPAPAAAAAAAAAPAPAKKAPLKKDAPKKEAPTWKKGEDGEMGSVTINGTAYDWDDDATGTKFLWVSATNKYAGAWDEKRQVIDATVAEPEMEDE